MRFARHYLDNQDGASRRHWINNLAIAATPEGARATNYFMILDVSVTPPVVRKVSVNTLINTIRRRLILILLNILYSYANAELRPGADAYCRLSR